MKVFGTASTWPSAWAFALVGVLGIVSACDAASAECVKARNAASNVWKSVRDKAGVLENTGAPGFEELSEGEKAKHLETFRDLGVQAEMLFKSFAFEKITWDTADPAKKTANELFDAFPKKADYKGFGAVLTDANAQHEAARGACK